MDWLKSDEDDAHSPPISLAQAMETSASFGAQLMKGTIPQVIVFRKPCYVSLSISLSSRRQSHGFLATST